MLQRLEFQKSAGEGRSGAKTALVLQGGGALGAYQGGVFEALQKTGVEIDWVAGISIGAINAALIAGNHPENRLAALHKFWQKITSNVVWPAPEFGDNARQVFNRMSSFSSMGAGQPGFFKPRVPPPYLRAHGAPGAASFYDTSELRQTLLELVDFDLINSGKTRLSVGAVNVRTGNFIYFDSAHREITPEHIMASGALPPGFPAVEIDGECYWDGGLVSNTPLMHVLEDDGEEDMLVFQVDLFSSRGGLPGDLFEVENRRKQIGFSSRTRLNTDHFQQTHTLKKAIAELYRALPPESRQDPRLKELSELGQSHSVSIIHLIYRPRRYELHSSDYEFSRASMQEHWQSGRNDTQRTLHDPDWATSPDPQVGVRVFDLNFA